MKLLKPGLLHIPSYIFSSLWGRSSKLSIYRYFSTPPVTFSNPSWPHQSLGFACPVVSDVEELNVQADPPLLKRVTVILKLKHETTLEPLSLPAAGHNQRAPGDKSCVSKPRRGRDFNNVKRCDETRNINQQPSAGCSQGNIKTLSDPILPAHSVWRGVAWSIYPMPHSAVLLSKLIISGKDTGATLSQRENLVKKKDSIFYHGQNAIFHPTSQI